MDQMAEIQRFMVNLIAIAECDAPESELKERATTMFRAKVAQATSQFGNDRYAVRKWVDGLKIVLAFEMSRPTLGPPNALIDQMHVVVKDWLREHG